ncbi:MaoC family dehydratase [Candidatus Marinimicrobia bacterium MT.SAG.3]|nr:MaoC family dehydratase [Candidatus Marinimicrobia bacterium MT.SAG.3]
MKLSVGQKASRTVTLTSEHVQSYSELTGDQNPLHFDKEFTAKTKFVKLVVQGGLTTGLLHALVAMDMPGPGTVFLSQNSKFVAPVFIGDTITATAEILSLHETKPVTQLGIVIKRQDEEVVLEGEAWCYTFRVSQNSYVFEN